MHFFSLKVVLFLILVSFAILVLVNNLYISASLVYDRCAPQHNDAFLYQEDPMPNNRPGDSINRSIFTTADQDDAAIRLNLTYVPRALCGKSWAEDFTCPRKTSIFVRPTKDYVGHQASDWEPDIVKTALFVMYLQLEQNPNATFVDFGANLGVFTFHIAARSFPVMAFEPMPANRFYLHKTLNRSQLLRKHVHLSPLGLGNVLKNDCLVWAHEENLGNGQISCDGVKPCPECIPISNCSLTTLDSISEYLPEYVGIAKVDIEALEPLLFLGGKETFVAGKIPIILMELSSPYLKKRSGMEPQEFIALLVLEYGFSIYESGRGPMNTPSEWEGLLTGVHDILLVHNSSAIKAADIFHPTMRRTLQTNGGPQVSR